MIGSAKNRFRSCHLRELELAIENISLIQILPGCFQIIGEHSDKLRTFRPSEFKVIMIKNRI